MMIYEHDPDVVRWGLHHLDVCSLSNSESPQVTTHYDNDLSKTEYENEGSCEEMENSVETVPKGLHHDDVCSVSNSGSPQVTTHYENDLSKTDYVNEGFCKEMENNVENDEMIAHALQEELKRVADAQVSGFSHDEREKQQAFVLAQDWLGPSSSPFISEGSEGGDNQSHQEEMDDLYTGSCGAGVISNHHNDEAFLPEIVDEYTLDGEVGKRLVQINPIPHVPRVNGEIPSVDEATSDHQRLLNRLDLYELAELKISGDGNCQFRSLSDQIYRSAEHHKFVREQVVIQLKSRPELYENYVPMGYDDYLKKMSKNGEWGDHVTLQAAADSYGVKIFVLTSFRDTCYIEIHPQSQKSKRIIFLSFWAEVHYNSIYPRGEFPIVETKKKKKWWWPGI